MRVVILAGGRGTRMLPETSDKPKPLIEIGNKPILWHLMKYYSSFGFKEFIIALGYKGDVIKRYMGESFMRDGDVTLDFGRRQVSSGLRREDDWIVHLVDTGPETMTGGRIKRLAPHLGGEPFLLTWGDGLANVDLHRLIAFHRAHGKLATLTAVCPPGRFGRLDLDGDRVERFREKPRVGEYWINGAFFVLEPEVLDYVDGDHTQWEREPLERLAGDGQLMAYRHAGFWQCVDTLPELDQLRAAWNAGNAPWKVWE